MGLLDDQEHTIFVSNLEQRVTEEHLWELFLQAGPMADVKIPTDRSSGKSRSFGFVTFKHACSIPYAIQLFNGIRLFNKSMYCKPKQVDGASPSTPAFTPRGANDSFSTPSPCAPPRQNEASREPMSRGYSSANQRGHRDTPFPSSDQRSHRDSPFFGVPGRSQDKGPRSDERMYSRDSPRESSREGPLRYDDQTDNRRYSPAGLPLLASPVFNGGHSPLHMRAVLNSSEREDLSPNDRFSRHQGPVRNHDRQRDHRDSRRNQSRPY